MADRWWRSGAVVALLLVAGGGAAAQQPAEAWVQAIEPPQYFAVYVEDVDRAVGWYGAVFGLAALGGSAADDGAWRIENLGNKRLLVELIYDRRAARVDRAFGFRKVGFFVPDLDAVADRVERATGERPRIVEFEPLGQRILQLRDPEGNVIQLLAPLLPPSKGR